MKIIEKTTKFLVVFCYINITVKNITTMKQEQKNLLLKDLLARLPYGVKVLYEEQIYKISEVSICNETITIYGERGYPIEVEIQKVNPYLFPFSHIYDNEELQKEFDGLIELELKAINDEIGPMQTTEFEVDFYNKHHLDWRGLIPKGLAIDATGKNIY